jgi:drug/metabolite transporter (DMT)-like permease
MTPSPSPASSSPAPPNPVSRLALKAAPTAFVLLWSTGFLGAKFGMPFAEPLTFLLVRFICTTSILVAIATVLRSPWPRRPAEVARIALVGILIQGFYLAGVFIAIDFGVPAGITALVVGLQPVLTAVASGPYLGERVRGRQWLGFALGLCGVALVVADKLNMTAPNNIYGIVSLLFALAGITAGTLYQKRHGGGMNIVTGSAIQFGTVGVLFLPLALIFETLRIDWTGDFVFALAWLTLVLSIGAISLFYLLIKRGAAATVASLFFLTPGVTALLAWFLFGETLGLLAIVGMAVAAIGVALVTRG